MQARRNREALLGEFDRRLKQRGPRQPTVLLVRHSSARNTPGVPTERPPICACGNGIGLPSACRNSFFGGAGRCGFATVVGAHLFAVPQHDHRAAADPGRLRLDQGQHRLHGNRRVDGRTALAQHLAPGLGGQRVGGCGHVLTGVASLQIGAVTGSGFRCQRQVEEGGALHAVRVRALMISVRAGRRKRLRGRAGNTWGSPSVG
jgi:hypothetical protein